MLPQLPVVIANSGHGGFTTSNDLWVQGLQNIISVAQENVACDDALYGGKVGFTETKRFYRTASESPLDAIHHFHNNAGTFLNIGKALGDEMIRAINDMAFCYADCEQQVSPGIVSIGNRVWNDLNRDGIQDPDEPGIPGVSLVIWSDPDGDGIPDWQGFGGVQVTDEEGYYRFSGLQPGNYVVFVWQVDNWGPGEPLHGFQSTNGFVADANNDVDFDNNGSGNPFTDIFSGIVTLTLDGEPLDDGDPFNCYFDYDASGNNTIDFGFFDPNVTSVHKVEKNWVALFPNPVQDAFTIQSDIAIDQIQVFDAVGRIIQNIDPIGDTHTIDMSAYPKGIYVVKVLNKRNDLIATERIVKQ
jgi:hypothetical protein